jgi:nodulation protein E
MNSGKKVVITGIGVISPLGINLLTFWQALITGQSGISTINQVDCSTMRFNQGAEIKNYLPNNYFSPKELRYLDRFSQFSLIAAKEAVINANLNKKLLNNTNTAVITGSCLGGKTSEDAGFYRLYHENNLRADPASVLMSMHNAGASHISAEYGIQGPVYTIATACASSTHAIGHAYMLIKNNMVDKAITGGCETPFSYAQLKAWEAMRIVAPDTCRPFSKNRQGIILGEGGAMFVLESLSSAKKRGAEIYAEIIGFGMSADAKHLIDPDTLGQQHAIYQAIKSAKISPNNIQYINSHGTGTILNDQIETISIQKIFKNNSNYHVSSTKSAHGHLLGAAGAIETAASIMALKENKIPPTINYLEKDKNCDLPLVINQAKSIPLEFALNHSFAFGGLNAALILKKN